MKGKFGGVVKFTTHNKFLKKNINLQHIKLSLEIETGISGFVLSTLNIRTVEWICLATINIRPGRLPVMISEI